MDESVTADSKQSAGDDDVGRRGGLDPRVRSHIGRSIKAIYDQVLDEPVPDRFVALLDELASKEREEK